ncbi:MAG: amino acid adenylation domain-containing protein, partial [bacterium]|nr:amino acid adenylation domain-containing protein [bacterium]
MDTRGLSKDRTIAAGQHNKEKEYWLKQMSGEPAKCGFPYSFRESTQTRTEQLTFRLPDSLFSQIMKVGKGLDHTIHIILTAGVVLLLNKYSYDGKKDIIVGAPIYKQDDGTEFINTVLALRAKLSNDITYKELLMQMRRTVIEADDHQNYPVEILLDLLGLESSEAGFPLFDVAVLLESLHRKEYLQHIRHNMTFAFACTGEYMECALEYNAALYHAEAVETIMRHYTRLMDFLLSDLDAPLSAVDILSEEEKETLLSTFNDTAAQYPRDWSIEQQFDEIADRAPDSIALVYEDERLTYRMLKRQTTGLAARLLRQGVTPGSIIGLLTGRSIEMIVGILGIIKAGAAYLPLSIGYPPERVKYLLADSAAALLVTSKPQEENPLDINTVELPRMEESRPEPAAPAAPANQPGDIAYTIYTSGSTGLPKGVALTHRNVINLVSGLGQRVYRFYPTDQPLRVALVAPYIFDASVQQIFGALLAGHALHVVPEEARVDGFALLHYYRKHRVEVSDGTPTHLRLLLESENNQFDIPHMKHFIIGGEALPPDTVRRFFSRFEGKAPYISNVYGPTECCVDSTDYLLSREKVHTLGTPASIPIGGPMPNERIYILNKDNGLLPPGVPGELCIAGDGVACGYLNRPQLTAEKFVPFGAGETLYKTGDLARWLPDGNIEFLGRMDFQVKIRGFRIEPGEIENRLNRHPQVNNAVITVRTDNNNDSYLCAYFVGQEENMTAQLKVFLLEQLPDYMIPAAWVQMESIPVTANGKVDRKALPEPETLAGNYAPPETELQRKLVTIWAAILGKEEEAVGIDSSFFEIGGHSLTATLLAARLHKELDVKVPLMEIFESPTIRKIAQYITKTGKEKFLSIEPVEKKEYYPVSSPQKRLYILQQMDTGNIGYNMPAAVPLEEDTDKEELELIFQKLIARHESLRTSFHIINENPVQVVHESLHFKIDNYETTKNESETIIDKFTRPFDLSKAPLLRVGLIKIKPTGQHVLLFDMHHIITDGTSQRLLQEEFFALRAGKEPAPLKLQYKDFSQWQSGEKRTPLVKRQELYWI